MADLAETVNERHAQLGQRAPQTIQPEAFGPIDRQRVLQLIGLNPRDPKAHAVVAVAERYGLDPVLGHIEILPRSATPYITRDGYLHIAHRSGAFDGMDVIEGPYRDGAEWTVKVAVYRKDMSHPFTYPGRASVAQDNGPEMAIARAERRALKRAFAVTLPRSFGDDDGLSDTSGQAVPALPPRPAPEPPPAAPSAPQRDEQPPADTESHDAHEPLSNGQRRAIFACFRELDIGDDQRNERLGIMAQIVGHPLETTNELTFDEAGEVITALGRLLDERKAGKTNGAMAGTADDGNGS